MNTFWLVAGHGDGDPGAVSGNRKESEYTRDLCYDIVDYCSNYGINVSLYDPEKDLYKSREYGKFIKGDEVLEVHFNAFNGKAYGTELLINSKFNADELDRKIYTIMGKVFFQRGIKGRSDLANMNNFSTKGVGYRLLEVCFIDNDSDISKYNESYNTIVSALGFAICSYMKESGETGVKVTVGTKSYLVTINTKKDPLNIRKGPGTDYVVSGSIPKDGKKYTIVEEKNGWGKLKSGAGWICLQYTKKV